MVFSSISFLFYFFPVVLGLYWGLRTHRQRNALLTVASVVFYMWGGGAMVFLLVALAAGNWAAGRAMGEAVGDHPNPRRDLIRTLAVLFDVGMLGYFKYSGWLVQQVNDLVGADVAWDGPLLPIGISFIAFHCLSYVVDVHRGDSKPSSFADFFLYITFFPHMVAGPIVRFRQLDAEIRHRSVSLDDVASGAARFVHGLAKKVLIADTVAPVANAAFASDADPTFTAAWVGVIAYTLQIYFDFSGYSDMGIGLGRMFGFHFPENFKRPYSALSITDFWRRWHITLSNWFRDYVYIPLGGSRGSEVSMYRNLGIVFLATGLWHGANWTFVIWGAYHGALMLSERATERRYTESAPHPIVQRVLTLLLVMVGWVLFRAPDFGSAVDYLAAMFTPSTVAVSPSVDQVLMNKTLAVMIIGSLSVVLPRDLFVGHQIEMSSIRWAPALRVGLVAVALPLSVVLMASGTFTEFLYFQF